MLFKCVCGSHLRNENFVSVTKCGHLFHERCLHLLRSSINDFPSCCKESENDTRRIYISMGVNDDDDTLHDDVLMMADLKQKISENADKIRDFKTLAKTLKKKFKEEEKKSKKFQRKLEAVKNKQKNAQQNLKVCKKENEKLSLNSKQLLKKIDDLQDYHPTLNDNIHYQSPSTGSTNTKLTDATPPLKIKTEPSETLALSFNAYENETISKLRLTRRSQIKRSGGLNDIEVPPKVKKEPYQKVSTRLSIETIYGKQAVKVEPEIRTRVRNVNGEIRALRSRIRPPSYYISLL